MPADNLKEQLDNHRDELKNHLDAAPKRIVAYYNDQEPPNGFPKYDVAPHQQIISRAASTIEFAFEYESEDPAMDLSTKWGEQDFIFSHIGVGLELLLQAIYMKTDPEDFIKKLSENDDGKTPGYGSAKNQLMCSLPNSLTSNQRAQICLVLEIVREQRNNTLHLGLHGYHLPGLTTAYYEVCAYLIAQFSDEQFDIVNKIDKHRTAARDISGVPARPPEEPLPLSTTG